MKRLTTTPRDGWRGKVSDVGLIYHSLPDGTAYWNESAFYEFTAAEVDVMEAATNTLHEMCLEAAQRVIDTNRFADLGISANAVPLIKRSWEEEPPAIYGRFDLSYDGHTPPKMLEYNADTPTSLLEASVIQWSWLNDVAYPRGDQFNSIHERLVKKWKELRRYITGATLYFAHVDDDSLEDTMTTTYLRDTATEAGVTTAPILMKDIGWDSSRKRFVDLDDRAIVSVFKLYPWEWVLGEAFGDHVAETYDDMQWIEPTWKMLLSNKGILGVLWEMFPNHPNLLPCRIGDPGDMKDFVRKPLLSREGANVQVVRNGAVVYETGGDYGEEGYVFQQWHDTADFDGRHPIIGSWVIDGESAGIGIRETGSLVTDNLSTFVPHVFR